MYKDPDKKATDQQRKISEIVVRAQEQERNHISTELHDNVNQLIVTAKLYIGKARLELGSSVESLKKAEEYLVNAMEGIKSLTRRLCNSLALGLEKRVAEIVESMEELHIKMALEIPVALVAWLSPEQQLMVFRIVQEQTSNILQYSGANTASIVLKQEKDKALLVITDNGCGFDKEKLKPGIGFINIYNRAAAFNGTVEIIASPGAGCTLSVRFPIGVSV